MTVRNIFFALFACALLLVGCATAPSGPPEGETTPGVRKPPASATIWTEKIIYGNTHWAGDVVVTQPVVVVKTGKLVIAPGTRVFFDIPHDPKQSPPPPWMLVTGSLAVEGNKEAPVLFTSVHARHLPDEDMLSIQGAKKARIFHARFERGGWGIHVHDVAAIVQNCVFEGNYGGARFRADGITFAHTRFVANRIGMRTLRSHAIRIENNTFRDNLTGIFFREGVTEPKIAGNNFSNIEYDLKLGEAQTDDVPANNNWWRSHGENRLNETLYDGHDSEGVGLVVINHASPKPFRESPEPQGHDAKIK